MAAGLLLPNYHPPPCVCDDCGKPYEEFGLDTTLSNNQWHEITVDGVSLLCANCIVKRAAYLPGAIAARLVIEIAVQT